jgi:hypothetical protein
MTSPGALLLTALRDPAAVLAPAEWDLLLRLARRARLLARLAVLVTEAGRREQIPARVVAVMEGAWVYAERRAQLLRWELSRLYRVLAPLGIPLCLLKGAAYLEAGLPTARGRLAADVDLLVPRADLARIEETLLTAGWGNLKLDPYDDYYYRTWMHELPPLRHRERAIEVDIHHTIAPPSGRLHPNPALILAAARPIGETGFLIPTPHDLVLHAAVHLFHDGGMADALRDLVDIDTLLRTFGLTFGFWAGLVPRAQELGLERPLYYALHYTRRLLATPVPPAVATAVAVYAPSSSVAWLMDHLVLAALLPEDPDRPQRRVAIARWLLYLRSHWLRMPPLLLARHLAYKATLSLRRRDTPRSAAGR